MTPYDWRIDAIEQKASRACDRLHEVDSFRSDVGRLECALREARTEIDGLRNELETYRSRFDLIEDRLMQLDYLSNNSTI